MIRDALNKDLEGIASIYNFYISHSVATFEEIEISPIEVESRISKVNNAKNHWIVAVENDEVVGYAYSTKWNERTAYRKTVEVSVYLSNTCLQKGIGTQLYTTLFDRLRDDGIHAVIAGITLPNPASVGLHKKFGMVKVAHFEEVGFKFGQWLDVGYWQVKLDI